LRVKLGLIAVAIAFVAVAGLDGARSWRYLSTMRVTRHWYDYPIAGCFALLAATVIAGLILRLRRPTRP
jgi:hypothetical protein